MKQMTDAEHKNAKGWECLLYLKNLKCCTIVKKGGVPDYAWMNQKMASLVSSGKFGYFLCQTVGRYKKHSYN